jgi:hypothetical protein
MPEHRDRIELEVPEGKVVIQHARCPRGCDLMDPEVPIHEHPSIHLLCEFGGKRSHIHLDPVYGSHDNVYQQKIPEGAVVELLCPQCGAGLKDPDTSCAKCSAPMFTLHLPRGSFVEACQRNGCAHHVLRIVTGEQLMERLFNDVGMDAYL